MEQDLKKYIGFCKDLEISLYKQERMIYKIDQEMKAVSNPRLREMREKKRGVRFYDSLMGDSNFLLINLFWCCVIIWAGLMVTGFIAVVFEFKEGTFGAIAFVMTGAIPGIICFILEIKRYVSGVKKTAAYNRDVEKDNKKIEQDNQALLKKIPTQKAMLMEQRSRAMQNYRDTQNVLYELYRQGIIYEKYRAIVPVCMFYEYLSSGICDTLGGPYGAYSRYEADLKANIIIDRLDTIITKLDEIKDTQYVLANAIETANRQLSTVSSSMHTAVQSLSNLENNQSLNTYFNGINAINTTCLMTMSSK